MRYSHLMAALLLLPVCALASVRDEIAAMEASKAVPGTAVAAPAPAAVKKADVMQLPDGRKVSMKDYGVVLFMQAHCPYSAKFDPTLKQWADSHGIRVYAYSLDGGGDVSFPTPLIPRRYTPDEPLADEILTFFGYGLPIATPTAFMVNVHTMKAYPMTQGVMDIPTLETRFATLIQADLDNLSPETVAPMPVSTQVTAQ